MCKLAKAAKLSPSKVREFLHSKTSYTRFTQQTRKFKRMRAFERFKNEIWCMDLAYVDKLSKDNNGVKYYYRTVDAKGVKTKNSKETVKTFSRMITKKNRPKKNWVDQGTEFAGEFKKFCSPEGKEIYYTMSETKATFAERTTRSLKNILYLYIEGYRYKYIQNLPEFIASTNSRKNRCIDMKPNHVKNSDFISILYSKPLREYKWLNLELEIEFSFPRMIYPPGKVINRKLHENFSKLLPLLLKNLQHIQSKTNKKKLYMGNSTRRN